ncbi:hypothetical protein PINS_up014499 [Pythium insidiosum]|nr:hypothetical protein PINS_up014499 [Pythium insidiosum]
MSWCKYARHRRDEFDVSCLATVPVDAMSTMHTTQQREVFVSVSASGITNPGHAGVLNQDAFFVFRSAKDDAIVLGVFDGHGKETGLDAAMTAKTFFEAQFQAYGPAEFARLEHDPQTVMTELFRTCHQIIKSVFRGIYEHRGYRVEEDACGGWLVAHDALIPKSQGTCIRGGTTATITVLLRGGTKIITANVGDSAAVIGGKHMLWRSGDVNSSEKTDGPKISPRFGDEIRSRYIALSGNHGADNEREYRRVRRHSWSCRGAQECAGGELRFLYDSANTFTRPIHVFEQTTGGGLLFNAKGDYMKNVRDEWASVVVTPADAPIPDSLAFTRSLGDFHMHAYGVTCDPTVTELSLDNVFDLPQPESQEDGSDDACERAPLELFIIIASDGVWDNWKYKDLFDSVAQPTSAVAASRSPSQVCVWPLHTAGSLSRLTVHSGNNTKLSSKMAAPSSRGVDRIATSLMDANLCRAQRIFGSQVDNMTVVVCRIVCQ